MNEIKLKHTCPLGHTCVKNELNKETGELERHQCGFYVNLQKTNPTTNETFDNWACGIAHQTYVLVDIIHAIRGTTAATESFREEVVKETAKSRETAVQLALMNPVQTLLGNYNG